MKVKISKTDLLNRSANSEPKGSIKGYPLYPATDDIYNKYQEEKDIDPEDISKIKELNKTVKKGIIKKKKLIGDASGSDLDIPGSELDDKQENIGSEDEENNYYSLGGDDHDDLDEDNGE